MEVIRIAVVGLGFMGKTHLGMYRRIPGAEVVAICDKFADRLDIRSLDGGGNINAVEGQVDLSGVRRFDSFDMLLEYGEFDAVDICLPTDLHADYALRALEAGHHTFVEKPLATNYNDALRVAKAAKESGRVCAVGQCLRFWPAYTEAKRIIDSGHLGRVRHAEFFRYSPPAGWAAEGWLADSGRSGNASLDLHIHDVDMILYLFGTPKNLRSVGIPDGTGFFSHISTVYEYSELSVLSTGGWAMSSSTPFSMRALYILEKGVIDMNVGRSAPLMVYPDEADGYAVPLPEGDGYYHELVDFVGRCEAGTPTDIVSPTVAAESVRVALLEIASANEGSVKAV